MNVAASAIIAIATESAARHARPSGRKRWPNTGARKRMNASPQSQPSGRPTQPPTIANTASTISGIVITGGDSWT